MPDLEKALEESRQIAEYHAHSVRQLIAQRNRLFRLLDAIGAANARLRGEVLAAVLDQIKQTPTEVYQDIYCMVTNGGKRNGFFVEFGACDGKLLSNTLLLEKNFGWTGILSEPLPAWHAALRQNRSCTIDERCVWSESGARISFAEFFGDEFKTQSTASVALAPAKGDVKHTFEVETVSLVDLLKQHDAPKHIDFLSVDVEGSEYQVLKGFPFDDYTFDFICVEQGDPTPNAVRDLLLRNGYKEVYREASAADGFYIRADVDQLATGPS